MRTPYTDDLMRQIVTFSRAYTDTPLCAVSRTSIVTGKTSFWHVVLNNGNTCDVMGETDTLPTFLKALGNNKVEIGKIWCWPQVDVEEREVRELLAQFRAGYHTEGFGIDARH